MVLDINSCATSVSITVGQPIQVGAVLTPTNILCNGDPSGNITVNSVTGTTGPYTYNWSDGHNDPINQNLTAGTYDVTITDGNGCSNTFTQTLTEPLVISTTLSYSDISVNGASDGNISANVSGGKIKSGPSVNQCRGCLHSTHGDELVVVDLNFPVSDIVDVS